MPESASRHPLSSILLDLAPWFVLSAAFLTVYIGRFGGTAAAATRHLELVVCAWVLFAAVKLAAAMRTEPSALVRHTVALCTTLALSMLALYYAAVLVGLAAWGRVITWPLVRTYLNQSGQLLDALGIPALLPWLGLAGFAGLTGIAVSRWFLGWGWCRATALRLSRRALSMLLLGSVALILLLAAKFRVDPGTLAGEPVALTFADQASRPLQSHAPPSSVGEAKENLARSRYPAAAAPARRNVVLIVGDALRADRVPSGSYARALTPGLDAILASTDSYDTGGVRTVCAESSCGLLALAASRYVHELPNRPFTLHEALRAQGYRIGLILGGDHTNFYGLGAAYGKVDSYFDGSMQRRRYVNDDRLLIDHVAGMPKADAATPFMLQFHMMSTHALGYRSREASRHAPYRNYYTLLPKPRTVDRALRSEVVNYYDNGVRQFDLMLSELLRRLGEKGYLDNTLVVITGDHGEMLGSHHLVSHANGVYEEVLSVPLVLIAYGFDLDEYRPRRLASQIDVAPTILAQLKLPIPSSWSGLPLQGRASHPLIWFQQAKTTGLYDLRSGDGVLKYWRDWESGDESVFNLTQDPGESLNLVGSVPLEKLSGWRRAVIASRAASVDQL